MKNMNWNRVFTLAAALFLVFATGCSKKSEPANGANNSKNTTNTTNGQQSGASTSTGKKAVLDITVNHLPVQAKMVMALHPHSLFSAKDLDDLFDQGLKHFMLQSQNDPAEAAKTKAGMALIKSLGVKLSSLKAFYFAQGDFKGDAVGIAVTDINIKKIMVTFLSFEGGGKEIKKTNEVVDGMEIWVNGDKSAMTIYKDTTLLIADNVEDLKLVIASVQGKGPTVKENKEIQALLGKTSKTAGLTVAGTPDDDEPSDVKRLAMSLTSDGKETSVDLYVVPQEGEVEKMKQGVQMLSAMKPMLKTQLDRQFGPMAPILGAESADTMRIFYTQLIDSLNVDVSDGEGMRLTAKTTVSMDKLMALSTKLGMGYMSLTETPGQIPGTLQ